MPDLVLTDREQVSVRALMALEPTPGALPGPHVLQLVSRLVPSDTIDVSITDATGCVMERVALPHAPKGAFDPQVCDGPLPLGLVHQSRDPDHAEMLRAVGLVDGVVIGFRTGRDHISGLSMDRSSSPFRERDLAMLRMIAPALQRLLRTTQTPTLPASLTVTERRVLQLLATGMSNADLAYELSVAPATIRKHLEHTYRKLGVSSRVAAVHAFRGESEPHRERAG